MTNPTRRVRRAAEPATPPSPSTPDRRNAESERPGAATRRGRTASAIPAPPSRRNPPSQRNHSATRSRTGRVIIGTATAKPARPDRARPSARGRTRRSPDTFSRPTGRATLPARTPTPGAPPATAQPSPSSTPQQPDSTAARTPATPDQQRAISETIERQVERQAVRPTRDIGVSVSVGTALPERVRIERLPREIVDVRPQYRDYGVVVTERETVIVDPRTRRVVEVIDRRAAAPTTASSSSASSADPSVNGAIPASRSART